jgi:hypothetical protein
MKIKLISALVALVGLTGSLHAIQNFNYDLTFGTGAFTGTTVAISFDLSDGLATPASPKTLADVSNFSVTVGTRSFNDSHLSGAFINVQDATTQDLKSGNITATITPAPLAAFYINFATNFGSINDSTQGGYSTGRLVRTTASVPDGGITLMLLGLGIGGLAIVRRKLT